MQRFFILVGHFFAASLLTFICASIVHSQFILHGLTQIGVLISWTERLSMTLQDIQGLFASLGAALSGSLLLAFTAVKLLGNWQTQLKPWFSLLYPLAGMFAVWVMLAAMQPIMHITLIASARTATGVLCLCLCGALGGWVFWRLRSGQALRS